jgi:hypothetical protein
MCKHMDSQVHGRNTVCTLTVSQMKKIESSLGKLRGALEKMYDISLPAPCFPRGESFLSSVKKFCGGLLETGTTHLWRSSICNLDSTCRMSIAGSLFMFRKVLPTPDPDVDAYIRKMSTPQPDMDPGFLLFVKQQVPRIFRGGWDRSYVDNVLRTLPSTSSCSEGKRSEGGCRGMSARGEWLSRYDAVEFCLSSPSPKCFGPSRVCSVDTGGKKRIISIPPADMNLLRPLHVTMYDHLSKFPWLLRGDAKPSRFHDFTFVEGEIFVSGDYESATDNLNSSIQKLILELILSHSSVPQGIKEMATSTLSLVLESPNSGKYSVQRRGQLMGNLLSFPLLCLVNFLAFKYAIGRNVPLRINGDDIVFRCTKEECDRWMKMVGRCGLTLSLGKTMVDKKFFSLNSCFFRSALRCVRRVPIIRSTALGLGTRGESDSLQGRFRSYAVGFGRRRRDILDCLFLRVNSGMIHATNRSVTRGLGMYVSYETLVETRMWARENFYLSMEKERPLPPKKSDLSWHIFVPGWRRTFGSMTEEDREAQKQYAAESVDVVWSTVPVSAPDLEAAYRYEVKEGTFSFSTWLNEYKNSTRRWSRLMGVGRRRCFHQSNCSSHCKGEGLNGLFRPRKSLFFRWPKPIRRSWFFISDVATVRRNIKFVANSER